MKKNKKKLILTFIVAAFILQSSMCLMATSKPNSSMDIVQIAQGNKDLSTLVTALDRAGLVDTLKGSGPFTVFAPTNEAFNKLPNGVLNDLLKPENKDKLVDILTYHVKNGKITSSEAMRLNGQTILMLNSKPVKIEVKDGNLYIDGAKVVLTDIDAKNGIIHIIDAVMQP